MSFSERTTTIQTMVREADEYLRHQCKNSDSVSHIYSRTKHTVPKLNLDESAGSSSASLVSNPNSLYGMSYKSVSKSFASSLKPEYSDRSLKRRLNEKEAEIHYLQAVNHQLQANVSNQEPEVKRQRIEIEKELEITKQKLKHEQENSRMIATKLKQFNNEDTELRESFEEMKEKLQMEITKLHAKHQISLKKSNSLEKELQEEMCAKMSITKAYENEIAQLKSDLYITEDHHRSQKEQFKIINRQMQENFEAEKQRLTKINEMKINELETKIRDHEEAEEFINSMKSNIKQLIECEKQARSLREENKILKSNQDNILLLNEKLKTLQDQLNKQHQTKDDLTNLQIENHSLKAALAQWESLAKSQGDTCSPSTVSSRLALLQKGQLTLKEEVGQLKADLKVAKANQNRAENESQSLKLELDQVKKNVESINQCARKLKHRQLLLSKECDYFKRVISSYENEVTLDLGHVNRERISTLENLLDEYKILLQDTTRSSEAKDMKNNQDLLEEINRLKNENVTLNSQMLALQDELTKSKEQMPTTLESSNSQFNVWHCRANPVQLAEQRRHNEIVALRGENEKLKLKIQSLLEKKDCSDITLDSGEIFNSEQIKGLQDQLQSSEQKNKRMMEAFKRSSTEFREISYLLTGYRIDIISPKKYKLSHVFAESSQDHLLFETTDDGKLQLLETEFSKTVLPMIEDFLGKQNCIPAFLSNLTLDLYSRQTRIF